MPPPPDLYACLGVERAATAEQIRQAYRQVARRFHPDVNPDPAAHEEFKAIAAAYEVLGDPVRRAEYDTQAPPNPPHFFTAQLTCSRSQLLRLAEPQIVYVLAEIAPQRNMAPVRPPLNLGLAIDCSTSMQGIRLDQVKSAARQIIETLNEQDTFSVVAFSDRAEVILPAQPCINKIALYSKINSIAAGGGTEILQGVLHGLLELQGALNANKVNHLILLTDGRTYGDEDDCLLLAQLAEQDGILISGLGIGDEWNDSFMDQLAAGTGGEAQYVSSPEVVTKLLADKVKHLGETLARLQLRVICDPGVKLKSVFKVAPEAQPLAAAMQPIRLGNLFQDNSLSLLLEFVISTTPDSERSLARLQLIGDILNSSKSEERWAREISLPQTDTPSAAAPPPIIVTALDKLTLYRLQEQAWADAEEGNIAKATQRLQTLASRLLATGEQNLANIALGEAARLSQTRQISAENRKRIKYGTRALIPRSGSE